HMDTIQVGQALSEVRDAIKAQNGNDLIDLMVFDCCLLAKIEVLKEIAEYVHGLYACENVQINWYAYDDFLRALNAKPDVDGAALAKVYHKSYVDFMRNWARQKGQADKMVLTSTSFDMTKFGKFDEAFKKFSQVLNNYADTNLEAVQTVLGSLSPITDVTVFDLIDFVKKIQVAAKDDKEMAKACKEVLDAYGAPTKKVNLKEFNLVPYPSSSFILQESHNYLEATGNGLSIGVFTKPSWLKIAAGHPEWGLNDASLGNFLNKFKAGNYKDLKFSQETEWDEFLYKMIDKN
ncbi:MAG TPA: clostripain-related cysteine peptidase, partial [Candidatus Wallbacteria bacterium]|nr:clostripain-related cysteine peptidase [Candidatus Wallbacteria bacterium]